MLTSHDFPHLAPGEIAFRAVRPDQSAGDVYAQASVFLEVDWHFPDRAFYAEGMADNPAAAAVVEISEAELRRLARIEAHSAGIRGAAWRVTRDALAELGANVATYAASDNGQAVATHNAAGGGFHSMLERLGGAFQANDRDRTWSATAAQAISGMVAEARRMADTHRGTLDSNATLARSLAAADRARDAMQERAEMAERDAKNIAAARDGYAADVERLRAELAAELSVRAQAEERADAYRAQRDSEGKRAEASLTMLRRLAGHVGQACTFGMRKLNPEPMRELFDAYGAASAFVDIRSGPLWDVDTSRA